MPGPRTSRTPTAEWAPQVLVAVLVVAVAGLLRVSFPLLYRLAEDLGFLTAAWVVPVLFASTLLAAPIGRFVGPRAMIAAGGLVVGLAAAVAQVQPTPALAVTMTAVVVGLVALPLVVRVATARVGATATTGALFVGLALDAGVRLAFVTWDPAWQTSVAAWLVGLGVATAVVVATVVVVREPSEAWGVDTVRGGLVVGPVLALQTLALASPGFVASSAGVGLGLAGIVVVAGLALAASATVGSGRARRPAVAVAALVLVAVMALATGPTAVGGPMVIVLVLAAQWATGALVVVALGRVAALATAPGPMAAGGTTRSSRTGAGAGIGALVLVLGLLPYQISYELDLGVPQAAWPVLVALVLVAVANVGRPTAGGVPDPDVEPGEVVRVGRRRAAAPLVVAPVVVVPLVLALTAPSAPAGEVGTGAPGAGEALVRVATYNLHSGVGVDGRLDPERLARVLEDGGAEVMALQEVARGWPLAGGLDLGAWLARRLDADIAYGPAADRQFGNAVLSTRPIQRWRSGTMPKGEGPMRRGWVAASVAFDDDVLEVFSIHLQHQDDTTATRQDQARLVLAAWDGAERTVLAGDLNSRPGSPDIAPWFDATGLVSAQADGEIRPTSPAGAPDHTIGWILATPDLAFRDVDVPATTASDHLPIFADVTRSP